MALGDRLRALDERAVWAPPPGSARARLTPLAALALGLLAVCVYVGWSLVWGWPRAAVAVVALGVLVAAAARLWFAPPPQPSRDHGVGAPEA